MGITIKQLLSIMDKREFLTIFNDNEEEFSGTVEACKNELPNSVLDCFVSKIVACGYYGEGFFEIYREVRK